MNSVIKQDDPHLAITTNETRNLICIGCPLGCALEATVAGGKVVSVTGQECRRGEIYAQQECLQPERVVTALIAIPGQETPLSVKTQRPIPKDKIFACLAAIADAQPTLPIHLGEVIIDDVAGTGVAVVATRSMPGVNHCQ